MPGGLTRSFASVWADNLGDWTWPGQTPLPTAAEALPPAWVPAFPARGEATAPAAVKARRERARRLLIGVLLSALAAVSLALVLQGRASATHPARLHATRASAAETALAAVRRLPELRAVSRNAAGSAIQKATFASVALGAKGSFYVYLPPGYTPRADARSRYPVIYLLHGNSQAATAFLHVGLQGTLDGLIARRLVPPMIAVMIEGKIGSDNWRNIHDRHHESYALEVQELVDRMLPTIASREGRAVAGDSMGGFGAMNLALQNPARFGVVESWLGFFNGLEGQLRLDKPRISKLGLHAFVYGAAQDTIADASENAPFAAELRAAGADAHSAVYPGEHNLETVEAHLASMLHFAGRFLAGGSDAGARGQS